MPLVKRTINATSSGDALERCHDQIAFVFSVFVVYNNDELTARDRIDSVADVVKDLFRVHSSN